MAIVDLRLRRGAERRRQRIGQVRGHMRIVAVTRRKTEHGSCIYACRCTVCGARHERSSQQLRSSINGGPPCRCQVRAHRAQTRRRQSKAALAALQRTGGKAVITEQPWDQDPVVVRFMAEHPGGATLQQVADALGVSRERVRQIEGAALRKIRAHLEFEDPALQRELFGLFAHVMARQPNAWEQIADRADPLVKNKQDRRWGRTRCDCSSCLQAHPERRTA